MQDVVSDGGHLEHVLRGGVDQRIVRVEVTLDDRVAPVVPQQAQDRLRTFGGAAIDELAVLVVAQCDVLFGAELLQRIEPIRRARVRDTACRDQHEAEHDQHDADSSKSLCHEFPFPEGDL